jgi:cytochrome c oxidase cbb3-type subunit 1
MLDATRDFVESMELTVPYLQGRSVGGALMTAGHVLFALNLVALAFAGRGEAEPRRTAPAPAE